MTTTAEITADFVSEKSKPCRWWWRWFCKAHLVPVYHSEQCIRCRKIFYD